MGSITKQNVVLVAGSLNFDNDSSSKILEVNQGTYQVPITVRFQDANPVAGGFDGSAVLSVDIL